MKLNVKLLSSIDKVFPTHADSTMGESALMLSNEPFSFQTAFCLEGGGAPVSIYTRVESDLPTDCISQYKLAYVPVLYVPTGNVDNYMNKEPAGLFPDALLRRKTNPDLVNDGYFSPRKFEAEEKHPIEAIEGIWQGLWFTVNEREQKLAAGTYHITVRFFRAMGENDELGNVTLSLTVLPATLPEQTLLYTSWFHCDCLSDMYDTPMFSDRHFEIIRSYAAVAASHGMNMILLPAFTPPLDTPVGKERKTAQLVGVEKTENGYIFDFTLLERFVKLCQSVGITHFEHSHFFTQWGAHHAPKVMARVNGTLTRIFGWDTAALSDEYIGFLKEYLKALLSVLDKLGIRDKFLFHISDEPIGGKDGDYSRAYEALHEYFGGIPSGDALSHYSVYENSGADLPIVVIDSKDLDKFQNNCDNYWLYYTGLQAHDGCPNRLTACRAVMNRILGVYLYLYEAKGFLHWGYNYYYNALSHGLRNPFVGADVYDGSAGTSYLVYPDADGSTIPSARLKVQYEGFNDFRALCVLENKIGREAVVELIYKHFTKTPMAAPHSNEAFHAFRLEMYQLISE